MSEEKTYYNIEHTSKVSLRTYSKYIPSNATEENRKIFSEGAYRISICFTKQRLSSGRCFITISGLEFELFPNNNGNMVFVPSLALVLDGSIDTVRDDEMSVRFIAPVNDCGVVILFDRVVWKKDDNYYPAQALDKTALNELNQKRK